LVPRAGLGQAVAGSARLHQPVLAGGDHQWVGGDLVHDRLRPVWCCHDQDSDTASLGAVLVAVGAPAHLLGFGVALVSTAAWPIAILGSASVGTWLQIHLDRDGRRPVNQDPIEPGRLLQDRQKQVTQFGTQDQLLADDGLLMATIDQLSDIPGRFDDLAVIQRI
jgi:hypothetical protein